MRKSVTPKIFTKLFIFTVLFIAFCCNINAQTINGTVFFDGNNNGVLDASEVGFGGVVVNAYDASNALATTNTTAFTGSIGSYTLSGLTTGQTYRLEFIVPSGYNDGAFGTTSPTSIQFVLAGATSVNFGVYVPGVCLPTKNIRLASGTASFPLVSYNTALASWDYQSCQVKIPRYQATTHTEDASASQIGVPLGMASHNAGGKNRVIFTTLASPNTGVYPEAPDGKSALYMADYSGANNAYQGYKLLAKLSSLTPSIDISNQFPVGVTTNFGEYGLGGADVSEDNKTLYVVNMGNGKIVKLDISTIDYLTIPAGGYTNLPVSEITIPTAISTCNNGRFRPTGLEFYAGSLYVAGICDASTSATNTNSDLRLKVLKMNPADNSFTVVMDVDLSVIIAGAISSNTGQGPNPGWFQTKWKDDFVGGWGIPNGEVQPVAVDFAFDDFGSIILGMTNRKVYSNSSVSETGYMVRTWRQADGTFALENAGVSGPYTSSARINVLHATDGTPGNFDNTPAGPGQKWFFEQGLVNTIANDGHPYLFSGGVFIAPGTKEVVGGFVDPTDFQQTGGRYLDYTTGVTRCGTSVLGFKTFALTGTEGVCDAAPIEIGNRVWKDTDSDGIQDANEPPLKDVIVTLCLKGSNTVIATAKTDANGYYIFSTASGTDTDNLKYGLSLTNSLEYDVKITDLGTDASVTGLSLSNISTVVGETSGVTNTGKTLANSDAFVISGVPTATVKLGNPGENNHSYDFGFKPAASCSITLKSTVSGCYQNGGASKATVSVEVAWGNAPTGEDILVTYGAQTRTIKPGANSVNYGVPAYNSSQTIVSPQVVAFVVDADGASGQSITANFSATTTCATTSSSFVLPAACPPPICALDQSGGTVFYDYNANGIKESGETTGLSGVTVKAYDVSGSLVATTTTVANGKYVFTGLTTASYPIRVEFSDLPILYGQGTTNGVNGATTTQFISAANCSVDLGVLDGSDYCQTNPKVVIPSYRSGNPLPGGSSAGALGAAVSFDYNTSGLTNSALMAHAPASEVGTLWGTTYNKFTKKIFSSATVKRHAGLGPLGLGGIYIADFATPTLSGSFAFTPFIDVADPAGLNINIGNIADNATRGLNTDPSIATTDNAGYLAVGRVGIGGIDLSDDGNKLYFTNLFDNKLYEIDITAYNTSGTLPTNTDVKSYNMSVGISCSGGNLHTWAVKVHKGKVYTGMVCDASISQNKSDLRAYVQQLNGTVVSTVFDFPLTYPKGYPSADYPTITGWYPWSDVWATKIQPPYNSQIVHPEPILSAIEFDIDGSIVLGLADKTGIQGGWGNYDPDGDITKTYQTIAGGDILRAYSNGVSFVLENNAKAGPATGYGVGNFQGPGFGEFYNDNFYAGSTYGTVHAETVLGGLALRPGSGEVISTTMDPLDMPSGGNASDYLFSGGAKHLNNSTGISNSAYLVYQTSYNVGTFGKASGLGDVEVLCSTPIYLEIGNRVWIDSDKDGVQDPSEAPLNGVKVTLYKDVVGTLTKIAETTTSGNGEYYFSSKSKLGAAWTGTLIDTTLLPTQTYKVVFGESQYAANKLTVGGIDYGLTLKDVTINTGNDQNDSDAAEMSVAGTNYPSITLITGATGSVNHTYDAGFKIVCSEPSAIAYTKTAPTCTSGAADNNGKITFTSVTGADKYFINSGATSTGTYATATAIPVTGTDIQTNIPNAGATYTIRFYNGADACYKDTVVIVAAVTCAVPTLRLGNLVFLDKNNNGICEPYSGDILVDGVKVNLYVDNGDGVLTAADGAPIRTTHTIERGMYLFRSLAAGEYIVEIDPSNFLAGAPLAGFFTSSGNDIAGFAPDPDDNINNDDNGAAVAGFGVASKAITLASGTEPINDGDANTDSNLSVDFGFTCTGTMNYELFVTSHNANNIQKFNGLTGAFSSIFANNVTGAYDISTGPNGDLYVVAAGAVKVVKVNATSGATSDFFPSGGGGLSYTRGSTWGTDGNLYVTDQNGNSVLKFNGQTGAYIGVFVAPNSGGLTLPIQGIAFGPDGQLYVGSTPNQKVLRFDGETGAFIDEVATGLITRQFRFGPDGFLYAGGADDHIVWKIDVINKTKSAFVTMPNTSYPAGIEFGPDGNLYFTDMGPFVVQKVDAQTGAYLGVFTTGASLNLPKDLLFKGSACTTCTKPSTIAYTQTAGTCSGATPNDNVTVSFTGISNGDKADKVEAATYASGAVYTSATGTISSGAVVFTGLKHNTQYTFRVFNGSDACYKDTTFTTPDITCNTCTTPNAGADITLSCSGNTAPTTTNLGVATSGYGWYLVSQPSNANAAISNTGSVTNMTIAGDYVFELVSDTDANCKDEVKITIPTCTNPCTIIRCVPTSVQKL